MNSLEEIALKVAGEMAELPDVELKSHEDFCITYATKLVAALGAQGPVSEVWKPGNPVQLEEGLSNTLTVMLPMGMKLFAAPVLPSVPGGVVQHVCGLQGFGALDDVCPACASAPSPQEDK